MVIEIVLDDKTVFKDNVQSSEELNKIIEKGYWQTINNGKMFIWYPPERILEIKEIENDKT